MISVFIYDDSEARKDSLRTLLDFTDNMQCVGSANNCCNVNTDMSESTPDIVLMDIEMPHINGLEGLRQIKLQFPKIKVIMQTVYEDVNMIFKAFQYGAEGYILKKASIANITDSIDRVYAGQIFLTPSVALQIMNYFDQRIGINDGKESLSDLETAVIHLISLGYGYRIISEKLNLSEDIVQLQIKYIHEKITTSLQE